MSKQYGLILPGQQKKAPATAPSRTLQKPNIFDEESDSSSSADDDGATTAPQLKPRIATQQRPSALERRLARQMQDKALAEDPTVFQYDELYDEMETKREEQKQTKAKEPKKPKYITKLMETAERRKLENELRVERQVQKEREAEGEQFKDKESFVTTAYRKKLEEMRKLEEQGKREDYLESIGDVTKQSDLDGFYRHLYEQKLGTTKEPNKLATTSTAADNDDDIDNEISYKPIKSGRPTQQQQHRAYRKRHSSDEDENDEKKAEDEAASKKVHLTNNIDADSDFSIDSSSSSDEEGNDEVKKTKENIKVEKVEKAAEVKVEPVDIKSAVVANKKVNETEAVVDVKPEINTEIVPKPKKDIWKKRTVGEVFDAALQRYFERKAARNA